MNNRRVQFVSLLCFRAIDDCRKKTARRSSNQRVTNDDNSITSLIYLAHRGTINKGKIRLDCAFTECTTIKYQPFDSPPRKYQATRQSELAAISINYGVVSALALNGWPVGRVCFEGVNFANSH